MGPLSLVDLPPLKEFSNLFLNNYGLIMFLVNSPHSQSLLLCRKFVQASSPHPSEDREKKQELQSQGLQMKTTITEN